MVATFFGVIFPTIKFLSGKNQQVQLVFFGTPQDLLMAIQEIAKEDF
jgi:hypothetical protein